MNGGGVGVEDFCLLRDLRDFRECRFFKVVKLDSSGRVVVDFEEGERRRRIERSVNG